MPTGRRSMAVKYSHWMSAAPVMATAISSGRSRRARMRSRVRLGQPEEEQQSECRARCIAARSDEPVRCPR